MLTAQSVVLGGHACGAVVQVTNAQIATAQSHHRARTKAKAFSPQNRGFDDVQTCFQAAIDLQTHFVAQIVFHQSLLRFSQTQLPRAARVFHRSQRRRACAAIVA